LRAVCQAAVDRLAEHAALVPRNSRPSGDTYGLRITEPADPGHCLAGAAAAWSSAR
jgi:hypothetical protein